MKELILYSTLGCHLCEQAKSLSAPIMAEFDIELVEADIADDNALIEAYGVRIPVLRHPQTGVELGWPFGVLELRQWLEANRI